MIKKCLGVIAALILCLCACQGEVPEPTEAARPSTVRLSVCGQERLVFSKNETVGELLQRLNIPLICGYRASLPEDTPTYDGMDLRVDLLENRMQVRFLPCPYDTVYCYDPTLPEGQEEVLFPGIEGEVETVLDYTCVNSQVVSFGVLAQTVTREPIDQIVAVGTGERVGTTRTWPMYGDQVIILEDGQVLRYTHTGQFSATAYTAWVADVTGTTATGTQARVGAIAVDPKVIPYGTRMFIITNDGHYVYGIATAEDCGGAIKGNKVDLFFDTLQECCAFGRRNCTIFFLEEA